MELLLMFGSIIALTSAQRPSYAGYPYGTHKLESRFKETSPATPSSTPSRVTTNRLPTDGRENAFLNIFSQNQPIWFINNEIIENNRKTLMQGKTTGKWGVQGQQTESRNAIPHDREVLNNKHSLKDSKVNPTRKPKHQTLREDNHPMEFVHFFPTRRAFEGELVDRMPPFFFKQF